ncbi:hypothetical protein D9M71_631600 [compost metagenome]
MHAHEPAARADEGLHRLLLGGIEHIAGGVGEHHHPVAGQVGIVEVGRVLALVHRHPLSLGQQAQRAHRSGNRVVAELGGAGEHQYALVGGRHGRGNGGQEHRQQQRQDIWAHGRIMPQPRTIPVRAQPAGCRLRRRNRFTIHDKETTCRPFCFVPPWPSPSPRWPRRPSLPLISPPASPSPRACASPPAMKR